MTDRITEGAFGPLDPEVPEDVYWVPEDRRVNVDEDENVESA